ncbi:MAG: phosphatidylserine/phosphatidylglycerophosphate/cardiolipin synthase family protein [Parachlamydiales bacterium]|nr:phosphatidylserine/phosphatidylglycerophosphate/cardiolipin synthase family protein [Parachlamydiales bacterium]
MTTLKAIKNAKNSIYLVMFGLSDPNVLDLIKKKANEGIEVKIFYDKRSSLNIDLPSSQITAISSKGLMHQKILVIDKKLVFLGSANMTTTSLLMHDNMMIGFFSPDIADFLIKKAPFYLGSKSSSVNGQQLDLYLLPDIQNKAFLKIKNLIKDAKKSIKITMFTLTHPKLVEELILAKQNGVDVEVAIDFSSSRGASKKAIDQLKKNFIPIYYNKGQQLRHHKYILIDDRILITGSANWTKSAFSKNFDCFVVLYNLDNAQKNFMTKLWKVIKLESFQK